MKNYFKPNSINLSILCSLIIAMSIIYSCRKDHTENSRPTAVMTDPLVSLAKKWYDSTYVNINNSNTKQATQSDKKYLHDWSKTFAPYWSRAKIFTEDGTTFIELPAVKNGDMALLFDHLKDTVNYDFSRSGTMTDLLIIKQQGSFAMYAMTIQADSSYLNGDYSRVYNNSYQKMDTNFTGAVLFHQMDGTFVNGWRYLNGQVTRQLSLAAPDNSNIQNNKLKVDVTEPIPPGCGAIVVVTLWEDCTYYGNDTTPHNCYTYTTTDVYADCPSQGYSSGSGSSGSGGTTPPPPCIPPPASTPPGGSTHPPAEAFVKGKLLINVAAPPDGGGTTTPAPQPQPCPPTTTTIVPKATTKIDDSKLQSCLQLILAKIQSLKDGSVAGIIQQFSGDISGYNWNLQSGNVTGQYDAYTNNQYNSNTGTVTTTFDSYRFNSSSDMSIARTILHESVHAYLVAYFRNDPTTYNLSYGALLQKWNNIKNATANDYQHDLMTQNFMNSIALSLQEYATNQGYNITDPYFFNDMAWGGLTTDSNGNFTSLFLTLVPNQSDRDRILNRISIEQTGHDLNGVAQRQIGKPGECDQ